MSFDASQINFNPSWMQPASLKGERLNGMSFSIEDENVQELIDPIFANHRYGREDLLALIVKDMKAPEGLSQCPFFVDKPQLPIILQPLNETEIRLQQNINSSKALSALSRQDRQLVNGGESINSINTKWTVAMNDNRNYNNYSSKFVPNRWSGLNNSSGNGNESNNFRGVSRPGNPPFNRSATANLRLSTSEQSRSNLSSRYRISSTNATQNNEILIGSSENQSPSTSSTTVPRSWNKVSFTKSTESSKDVKSNKNARFLFNEIEKNNQGINFMPNSENTNTHNENVKKESVKNKDNLFISSVSNLNGNESFSQNKLPNTESEHWFYLDPSDVQRGPYESCQMQTWFDNGYFDSNLRIRRLKDKEFFTLGELFHINGAITPFISKNNDVSVCRTEKLNENCKNSPERNISLVQSSRMNELNTTTNVWNNVEDLNKPAYSSKQELEIKKAFLEKEKLIEEEQRKLKEKEDFLRREEQERLEKERLIREKELELLKKQEEIQRIAREKEEELEKKRHEVAEFERQRLEVVEKMEEKLRNEHLQQMRQKEEERLRLEAEAMKKLEAYRLMIQAEEKRKLEEQKLLEERQKLKEKNENVCIAYKETLLLQEQTVSTKIEKKKKNRQEEKEKLKREKINTETKVKNIDCDLNLQKKEELSKDEIFRLRQMEEELSQATIQAILNESPPPQKNKSAPWVTVGCNKHNKKEKTVLKQAESCGKTLVEIQLEEEELLRQKLKQQQELLETHQKTQTVESLSTAWTKSPLGSKWSTNFVSSSTQSIVKDNLKTNSWNPIVPPTVVPIPKNLEKNNAKKVQKTPTKTAIKSNNAKTKKADAFTQWIIKRVKDLNSSVDAEVFASFIEKVESPNDVEDYIMGYLGETKMAKDFYREFLNKRIELCPRVSATEKDDLSCPAVAANDVASSNVVITNQNFGQKNNVGGKKKKKGKPQKILDPKVLGFKVSGDPNRFNAGEIDTDIPVSTNRKR